MAVVAVCIDCAGDTAFVFVSPHISVFVLVVAEMVGLSRFLVLAIAVNATPHGLQRHQEQQEDDEEALHVKALAQSLGAKTTGNFRS